MVLVDLRNHGRSVEIEGLEPPHDITNATNDLANLVKAEGWAWLDVVIGHSMGGKVALHFIRIYAHAIYSQSATSPKQMNEDEVENVKKKKKRGRSQVTGDDKAVPQRKSPRPKT